MRDRWGNWKQIIFVNKDTNKPMFFKLEFIGKGKPDKKRLESTSRNL